MRITTLYSTLVIIFNPNPQPLPAKGLMTNSIISANIQLWRQKARTGTLTLDEMRQSIAAIRKPRSEAAEVSAASKVKKAAAKVKAAPINVDDLFSRLGIKPEDVQEPDTSTDTDTDSDSE